MFRLFLVALNPLESELKPLNPLNPSTHFLIWPVPSTMRKLDNIWRRLAGEDLQNLGGRKLLRQTSKSSLCTAAVRNRNEKTWIFFDFLCSNQGTDELTFKKVISHTYCIV